ncbi:MAG: LexA family transcriptional regulator [Syntrophomonadaceae bacterium]|nr:LexA family transcriptional regulator [Syntrophomonadaceae bacterium]
MDKIDIERAQMNQKFRSRLRELLDESGITQSTLAKAAGVSPAVISKYLSVPDKEPMFHIVAKIARHFDVSPEWLGGMNDERTPFQAGSITDIYYRLTNTGKNELYNFGKYLLAKEQELPEESSAYGFQALDAEPAAPLAQPASLGAEKVVVKIIPKVADFALTVSGDTMEPLVPNGALLFAKDQSSADNGDIVVAEVDGALTCKKYAKKGGKVELKSINPRYQAITDWKNLRIIGKVII